MDAFKMLEEDHEKVKKLLGELDFANEIMAELEETPVDDEKWAAKFAVLKENVEHHIEEEEDEMFKKGRQVLEKEQIETLGERMEARKKELQAS